MLRRQFWIIRAITLLFGGACTSPLTADATNLRSIPHESQDDLPQCSAEGEGDIMYLVKFDVYVRCYESRWITTLSDNDHQQVIKFEPHYDRLAP